MLNPIILPENIIKGIKYIISQAKGFSRPVQHEFIQQELYKFLGEEGFETFFEYIVEYRHIYRTTKKAGEIRIVPNGRLDIYARNNDLRIAIEFDSGATIKWKSIEKLLQSDAGYCFGVVSGSKSDFKKKIDMYTEKNLWKCQLTLKDHILIYDSNKEFDKLFNLINKQFWIGNIKTNELIAINLKKILSSSISLRNLKQNSKNMLEKTPDNEKQLLKNNIMDKHYVVVFKLENGKWYLGKTDNVEKYIKHIKYGNGPPWTRVNKFVSVERIIENGDLRTLTLDYMKQLGWLNVRGYAWRQINLKRPPIAIRKDDLQYTKNSQEFNETVYVLKLKKNKWFLGKCLDEYLWRRIEKQKNGLGTEWTKVYKVIAIDRLVKNGDLKSLTLEYMRNYGWENVRGYSWIQKNLKRPPKDL